MTIKLPKLIIILGPTASGKTEISIKLAKKFNGEIISADSRQIYKGMNIGTAKPSKKERNIVPHHLIDLIKSNQDFSVAVYKDLALKAIKETQEQRKIPFLVGGTGLYIQSIVDNIDFPKIHPKQKLRRKLEKKSAQELFKIYKKLDPQGAKVIDKYNKRRIVRAIEVSKISGQSFWEQRKKEDPLFDFLILGLNPAKKELEKRIEKRIENMFKAGLEKEVKKLGKKYGWKNPPLQTIGYQEWKNYVNKKFPASKEEIKKNIILHTLQFTKRQMTWFKRDKRIKWIKNYQRAEKLIKKFLLE